MCKVPANHYFALGDNRDDSLDSRYWGFIPEDHVLGIIIKNRTLTTAADSKVGSVFNL